METDFLGAEEVAQPAAAFDAGDFMTPAGSSSEPAQPATNGLHHESANGSGAALDEMAFAAPVEASSVYMDAFFGDDQAMLAAPAAPAEPEQEDPRVAWRKKNQKELAVKDQEEMAARKAAAERAAEHLKRVQEAREKALSARKVDNRVANGPRPEAGSCMDGTEWQKVSKLVNFTTGTHAKDVTRMRATLTAMKA